MGFHLAILDEGVCRLVCATTLEIIFLNADLVLGCLSKSMQPLCEGEGSCTEAPGATAVAFSRRRWHVAGAANLTLYELGAAYALQRATAQTTATAGSVPLWQLRSASSGILCAMPFALGVDCVSVMWELRRQYVLRRCRLGGCIGIFSCSVRSTLRLVVELAHKMGLENPSSHCDGRLFVDVTQFTPLPKSKTVSKFGGEDHLIDVGLASSYIPVVFEEPITLPDLGLCLDGVILNPHPNAQFVISPFHDHLPDITPAKEYPTALLFNTLHGDDVLRLFEDGYLDCMRWLEAGAPSRTDERFHLTRQCDSMVKKMYGTILHCLRCILPMRTPDKTL